MNSRPNRFSRKQSLTLETDRRKSKRLPIEREARYKTLGDQNDLCGSGMTINMSARGVLFTTEEALSVSQYIELAVSWPAKLHGAVPMQLVAFGPVVRAEETQAVITIERYEFKTCGSTAFNQTSNLSRSDSVQ
jgi:hypothetical protein